MSDIASLGREAGGEEFPVVFELGYDQHETES